MHSAEPGHCTAHHLITQEQYQTIPENRLENVRNVLGNGRLKHTEGTLVDGLLELQSVGSDLH